jgi:hypothetical protein
MTNTYAIIEEGVVVNKILARTQAIAERVSKSNATVVEDNNNAYSVGDTYASEV